MRLFQNEIKLCIHVRAHTHCAYHFIKGSEWADVNLRQGQELYPSFDLLHPVDSL